jgi:hypothetical protein
MRSSFCELLRTQRFERYFRFCGRLLTFLDFVTAFLQSEALIFARLCAAIIPKRYFVARF